MDKKKLIAETIKEILSIRGLQRHEFAVLLNTQPSCVTKWLSGTHNFTLQTLLEIEKQLNCTLISVPKPLKPIILCMKVYSGNLGYV